MTLYDTTIQPKHTVQCSQDPSCRTSHRIWWPSWYKSSPVAGPRGLGAPSLASANRKRRSREHLWWGKKELPRGIRPNSAKTSKTKLHTPFLQAPLQSVTHSDPHGPASLAPEACGSSMQCMEDPSDRTAFQIPSKLLDTKTCNPRNNHGTKMSAPAASAAARIDLMDCRSLLVGTP